MNKYKCEKHSYIEGEPNCIRCGESRITTTISQNQKTWEDDLLDLAEKYCKHNGGEMNNCLFYLMKPIVEKARKEAHKEIVESIADAMFGTGLVVRDLTNKNDWKKAVDNILKQRDKEIIEWCEKKEIDIDESGNFGKDNEAKHYRNGFNQALQDLIGYLR